jgi:threonylcarbamoyladenosine tRNA methylthiotransferase MtaB
LGGNVSVEEKKWRSEVLHALSEEKRIAFYESQMGRELPVLWEEKKTGGAMHGFTANYVRVERPYDKSLVNKISTVRLGNFNQDKSALVAEL